MNLCFLVIGTPARRAWEPWLGWHSQPRRFCGPITAAHNAVKLTNLCPRQLRVVDDSLSSLHVVLHWHVTQPLQTARCRCLTCLICLMSLGFAYTKKASFSPPCVLMSVPHDTCCAIRLCSPGREGVPVDAAMLRAGGSLANCDGRAQKARVGPDSRPCRSIVHAVSN